MIWISSFDVNVAFYYQLSIEYDSLRKPLLFTPVTQPTLLGDWAATPTVLSSLGEQLGKIVSLRTNINHPNEVTCVTRAAAQKLVRAAFVYQRPAGAAKRG